MILTLVLEELALPAALLLGPMIAAIAVVTGMGKISFPRWPSTIAQAIVGCLIAHSITSDTLVTVLENWPLFTVFVVSVIASSSVIGWVLARLRILPGTTAVWGSAPGGAATMSLMAESYGADFRLVAVMQYVRVVMVALTASLVTGLLAAPTNTTATINWFPAMSWDTAATGLIVAGGVGLGKLSRIPAGPLLIPMAVGSLLQATGILAIDLPPWLLAASYAIIGWRIGSAFTRDTLLYAARALPKIVATSVGLIAICSGIAAGLSVATGLDFLTSFLATSPGGADTIAIIASSTKVDASFVMAMQVARLVTILIVGPRIARFAARLAESGPIK